MLVAPHMNQTYFYCFLVFCFLFFQFYSVYIYLSHLQYTSSEKTSYSMSGCSLSTVVWCGLCTWHTGGFYVWIRSQTWKLSFDYHYCCFQHTSIEQLVYLLYMVWHPFRHDDWVSGSGLWVMSIWRTVKQTLEWLSRIFCCFCYHSFSLQASGRASGP